VINFFKKYKNLNLTLIDQAMVSGVNFVVSVALVRILGIELFGIFSLLWLAILFIQSIQFAVIISPMMSIGPKYLDAEKDSYYAAVLTHQIVFSIISSLILYISIIISSYIFPEWGIKDYAFILALTIFLSQNQDFIRRFSFIKGKVKEAFINDFISYVGRLAVLVIFFMQTDLSLKSIFWIFSFTLSISVIYGITIINKPSFDYKYSLKIFKRNWKTSKWLAGSAIMQWTSGNYFIIAAGAILGPASVGILRAAGNVIGITHILFQGLENIVPASASKNYTDQGTSGLKAYLIKVLFFGGSLFLVLTFIISIFSGEILSFLYGEEYYQYRYILFWYAMVYIVMYSVLPLTIGLRTLENTKPLFFSYLVTTIFSLICAKFFVENFLLSGVMMGMMVNQFIFLGITYFYFQRTCRTIDLR
tara:strand:- start:499 stop:1755 length:1257 start_codon:yes stop_codon:yes gene_type:complete